MIYSNSDSMTSHGTKHHHSESYKSPSYYNPTTTKYLHNDNSNKLTATATHHTTFANNAIATPNTRHPFTKMDQLNPSMDK